MVALLADELVERGHEVTLFASGGSETKGTLVSYYETPPGTTRLVEDPMAELPHVLSAYMQASEFDVVHDHSSPIGCSLGAQLQSPPVVHTIHGPLFDPRAREIYSLIHERVGLISISNYQREGLPNLDYSATVYNGIDLNAYPFREDKKDYLLFLGRMSEQKGVHTAVEVAKRLGRKLVIATKIAEPGEKDYFETRVKPLLTGEEEIVGELSLEDKVELYANAACTLMPIEWPEPFGLVMTESMACGTPVVAFRQGSVPEIIDDGVTGYIADDLEGFVEAVGRVEKIQPAACRASVEQRFSVGAMVDGYESVYREVTS